ncbi:MAG: hypothetical protein GY839_09955 [candidate division Zixibacteria bacterium]|nr:hypothetical protein [candidate division Zixibacteria bacterium]
MKKISSQNGVLETTDFVYDALDRLRKFSISTPGKIETTEYTYLIYSRKTEQVFENDLLIKSRNYYYDKSNWLTLVEDVTDYENSFNILYFYDKNGNTITKIDGSLTNQETNFTYNSLDQLVQATRGPPGARIILGQYDYNTSGLRVRHRYSERGDVNYYYDQNAVLEERKAADDTLLAHYSYADRLLNLSTDDGIQYYHHDALGSTVNLTDSDGNTLVSYTLDPWGNIRSQSGSSVNRQIFTGQEYDENTGLIYFGARYYDPDTSRFITQDPYLGDNSIPPSLHRYLYAYSNPTVYVDLYGYESLTPSDFFGNTESVYDNTTWIEKPEDKYDEYALMKYEELGEKIKENPYTMIYNAPLHTVVYAGQVYADVLRIGEGVKSGGWGYGVDLLRSLVILSPFIRSIGPVKTVKAPKGGRSLKSELTIEQLSTDIICKKNLKSGLQEPVFDPPLKTHELSYTLPKQIEYVPQVSKAGAKLLQCILAEMD